MKSPLESNRRPWNRMFRMKRKRSSSTRRDESDRLDGKQEASPFLWRQRKRTLHVVLQVLGKAQTAGRKNHSPNCSAWQQWRRTTSVVHPRRPESVVHKLQKKSKDGPKAVVVTFAKNFESRADVRRGDTKLFFFCRGRRGFTISRENLTKGHQCNLLQHSTGTKTESYKKKTPAGDRQSGCLSPSDLHAQSLQKNSLAALQPPSLESFDSAHHADQNNHSERSQQQSTYRRLRSNASSRLAKK